MFERVLIANRGEIARRIARTCRRLGIATVAVHSDADAGEPHVREADTAAHIGPAPAGESYLDIDRIVTTAAQHRVDAIHPGYGFLAENARFARAVRDAGLVFVGPSPEAIELMGDKAAAKAHLAAAGVGVVPGLDDPTLSDTALIAAAADVVGVPLLVKAVAGGGGKGMRLVTDLTALPDALSAARREAAAAFGDDRVILERFVPAPRHVEVQVLADRHGTVRHVLERECSIQRRHQKVVEECPSPAVSPALRARMGEAAVRAAASVGYEGAGTVELLLEAATADGPQPRFHFLEMNTRLQVEHPVTELVTGLDLVEWQLRIAAGERLPFSQEEIAADGHAIEVRLYAEHPTTSLPQTGTVLRFEVPDAPGVRSDTGVEAGSQVTRHYDPMLAKLCVHAPDRDDAVRRLRWLLERVTVHGVTTNLEQLAAIASVPAFAAGELTTGFIEDHLAGWSLPATPELTTIAAAAALALRATTPAHGHGRHDPFATLGPFRAGLVGGWRLRFADDGTEHLVTVTGRERDLRVRVGDDGAPTRQVTFQAGADDPGRLLLVVDGTDHHAVTTIVEDPDVTEDVAAVWVSIGGLTRQLTVLPATRHADARAAAGGAVARSPMPGAVLKVAVRPGDHVEQGATLAVVEAMKMEHPVTATAAGTITTVHVTAGQAVEAGALLAELEPDQQAAP